MLLWIILIIPIVQVTTLQSPRPTSLFSLSNFMKQLRYRIGNLEEIDPKDYRESSKLMSRLTCRINEASSKLQLMGDWSNKDGHLYQHLGEALNLGNFAPLRKIQHNSEKIKELSDGFLKRWSTLDLEEMRYFIPQIIESSSNYVPALLEETYRLIAPNARDDNGYTRLVEKAKNVPRQMCGVSIDLALFRLHVDIVHAELTGFVMGLFAYALKAFIKQKSYDVEMDRLQLLTHDRLEKYLGAIKNTAPNASEDFFNCEHRGHHTRESTYIDFQGLIQGYFVNEGDIAPTNTCYDDCKGIPKLSKNQRWADYENSGIYERNRDCTGDITDCSFFGYTIEVCYANENSGRRYDYLNGNISSYGKEHCSSPVQEQWYWRGTDYCEHCFCTCIDNGKASKATRAISFRWSMADYQSNKVVIGMRFILKNNVMRLQAYEGKLLAGGVIESGSEAWVPLEEFQYRDEDQLGAYYVDSSKLNYGSDFMFLGLGVSNFIVDDLNVGSGRAIVGIRFTIKPKVGFTVEAKSVPINIATGRVGKLSPSQTPDEVASVDNRKYAGYGTGRPIDFQNNVLDERYHGMIFMLSRSDLDDDAGQSTIPFFDARGTIANFPISGFGIAYKNDEQYRSGGFFIPILKTYNFRNDVTLD